jgi:hypothetical protein
LDGPTLAALVLVLVLDFSGVLDKIPILYL